MATITMAYLKSSYSYLRFYVDITLSSKTVVIKEDYYEVEICGYYTLGAIIKQPEVIILHGLNDLFNANQLCLPSCPHIITDSSSNFPSNNSH